MKSQNLIKAKSGLFNKIPFNLKLIILFKFNPDEFIRMFKYILPDSRDKMDEVYQAYHQAIIINKEVISGLQTQSANLLKSEVLPLWAFNCDAVYHIEFDGTDSLVDEMSSVFLNNLFMVRQASNRFRFKNCVDIVAGIPYSFSTSDYYNTMANLTKLSLEHKYFEKYKKNHKKLFKILDENGIKFNDFLLLFFIIQEKHVAYWPKVKLKLDAFFEECPDRIPIETIEFLKNIQKFEKGYFDEKKEIGTDLDIEKFIKLSNLNFIPKVFNFVNSRKNCKLIIFITYPNNELTPQMIKEFSEEFKEFNNTSIEKIKDTFKEKVLVYRHNEIANHIEFNIFKFGSLFKPLLFIEIKNSFDFFQIKLNQYFISKYLTVRILSEANVDSINQEDNLYPDFIWSWDDPSLPKILLNGSLIDLK